MIKFKLLQKGILPPRRMTIGAAGFDFTLPNDVTIGRGQIALIPLGVACEIPEGHVGILDGRSSSPRKKGLIAVTGYIDSDYRDEIHLQVINRSWFRKVKVKAGERVGQIVVVPFIGTAITVNELGETGRKGGFGHTGN